MKNVAVHLKAFGVLRHLYGSRAFGKRRFLLQKRKQKFDATFVNEAAAKFRKAAGVDEAGVGRSFVVACGDGNFPLSMKGMDVGGCAHKRLMRLLSRYVSSLRTNTEPPKRALNVEQQTKNSIWCSRKGMQFTLTRTAVSTGKRYTV